MKSAHPATKPWWQQATALVSVSTGGVITGLSFAHGAPATMTAPAGTAPVHLMALEKAAAPAGSSESALASDTSLRSAIVNVAKYYHQLARTRTPAQMEALIWGKDSTDGADHGDYCAAFASLTLELGSQAVGQESWVKGGSTYPWAVHDWVDARVDPNPASPQITSVLGEAEKNSRWHAAGDGYQPQPGDWVLFDQHVEVVTGYSHGVLDTIGGNSLPDFSVNAHTYSGSLASHGIEGFVDNGNLSSSGAATPQRAAAPQHSQDSGGGQQSQQAGSASIPGATLQSADGPGTPAAQAQPAHAAPAGPAPSHAAPAPAPAHSAPAHSAPAPAAHPAPAHPAPEHAAQPAQQQPTPSATIPGLTAAGGSGAASGNSGAAPASDGSRDSGASSGQSASSGAPDQATSAAIPGLGSPAGSGSQSGGGQSGGGHASGSSGARYSQHAPAKPAPAASKTHQAFINSVAPGAIAAQQRWGVPASVTIAQAIEESDWGTSQLAADNHNLFGIKGSGPAGAAYYPTQEFEGGHWITINAAFRAYHNMAESISDHAELLATSGHYGRAMADRRVPDAFASDLTGVYATDPDYGSNLIATMKLYDLYQYDTTTQPAAQSRQAAPAHPAAPANQAATSSGTAAAPSPGGGAAGPGGADIPGLGSPSAQAKTTARYRTATPHRTASHRTASQQAASQQAAPQHATLTADYTTAAPRHRTAVRQTAAAARYTTPLPGAVTTAYFTGAKTPIGRSEQLYKDVAGQAGISWKLLAACDWMQCQSDPRRSPVHGEKLGSVNRDGSVYGTKSEALTQCAADMITLARAVYGIDLTVPRPMSIRSLAEVFAAYRWGGLLKKHGVSAMELPYSVAGLTDNHTKMQWPSIREPNAPDKPGSKFKPAFGAVPVVLSLKYPATV